VILSFAKMSINTVLNKKVAGTKTVQSKKTTPTLSLLILKYADNKYIKILGDFHGMKIYICERKEIRLTCEFDIPNFFLKR
jgi:hypothetical protein